MSHTKPLTARDMAVLEFERTPWKYEGAKNAAIRDLFGVSSWRYSQILTQLLDDPAAETYDPVTVRRLRRLRSARRAHAGGHRLADPIEATS